MNLKLQRLRRNTGENAICDLYDAVRELKLDLAQLKFEVELLKNSRVVENWIATSR
jgi:hypothetical protein